MNSVEAAKLVLSAKGIEKGFVHHCIGLHKDPKAVRNPGGGFQSSHEFEEYFRVVLYMERSLVTEYGDKLNGRAKGGMAETENTDLFTAIREAFEILQLPLPAGIPAAPTSKKKK